MQSAATGCKCHPVKRRKGEWWALCIHRPAPAAMTVMAGAADDAI